VIRKLLCVHAQGRPTCEQILNSELVQKNLIKLNLIAAVPPHLLRDKSYAPAQPAANPASGAADEGSESPDGRVSQYERKQILMNTIQLPKNFRHLSKRLPRANYDGGLHQRHSNRRNAKKSENHSADVADQQMYSARTAEDKDLPKQRSHSTIIKLEHQHPHSRNNK